MDEYMDSMKDFSPNAEDATGLSKKDQTITVVESVPEQTALNDNQTMKEEQPVPKYLAPNKIEVKRYILKK